MPIGLKETQEIIRQAAVLSRSEPPVPAKLEPREVGMATGPRRRKRALMRAVPVPDYLEPSESPQDVWQKLDDDIYKFLQLRKDQFGRMDAPPSHQFIAEIEAQLRSADSGYELGTYLGLVRQAADLDQTRQTYVTASEKGTFHAFARRIGEGRRQDENFDPAMVKRYRDLLESNHPTTNRGLADLFRLVARAARMPLIGNLRDAPPLCIAVILEVVDLSVRFNQSSLGKLEFQLSPMDVFLGARAVLYNRSVANPTLSMVKELVVDESGLYHEDLLGLLQNVGVFGSELTLLMPESLSEEGFALRGARFSATELIMAAGVRLARSEGPIEQALATLADAIVYKVQQQDGHKDRQIQSILAHFTRLLQGERRSAARVTEDRQKARFDYMSAILKAGELAKGMQSGEFRALVSAANVTPPGPILAARPPRPPAAPSEAPHAAHPSVPNAEAGLGASAAPGADHGSESSVPAAIVVGGFSAREYEALLGEWDDLLGRARKKLTTRSPLFKSLASQLAKVRSLDTCLAYGLTPAGGRAVGRLARLLQNEGVHARLGLPASLAENLEDAFSMEYPGFLSSMEALIATVYGFRPLLHEVQFRLRDRLPSVRAGLVDLRPGGMQAGLSEERETTLWADASELDEVVLRLLMGAVQLAVELSGASFQAAEAPRFGENGTLAYPPTAALALGNSDPFLAYCTLLGRGKAPVPARAEFQSDPESDLMRLLRLGSADRLAMQARYLAWIGPAGKPSPLVPGLGDTRLREGWARGCERGYMAEVRQAFDSADAGSLERTLLELMTGIQADIDKAGGMLEAEKTRLIRERLMRVLE